MALPHLYETHRLPLCTFSLPVWNTKMLGGIPRSATGERRFPMQYSVSGDRNHAAAAVVMMVRIDEEDDEKAVPSIPTSSRSSTSTQFWFRIQQR